MTSDHGFGATTEVVYINEWLARNGYLQWSETTQTNGDGKLTPDRMKEHLMMIDWKKTVAYCPTPSSNAIYIKSSNGANNGVKSEDYTEFCHLLKQQLLDYRNPTDDEQIFVDVELNQAKINQQPYIEYSPDMIVKLRDGGFVSILKSENVVIPRKDPEGTHRPNGIFIARGEDINPQKQVDALSILDVTPILLHLLGLAVPKDLEGKVPPEIIAESSLKSFPFKYQGKTKALDTSSNKKEVSAEEKNALMEQLKLLGYMD